MISNNTAMDATPSEESWEDLVANLKEGRKSVLNTIKAAQTVFCADGDYEGFVTYTRVFHMLMEDVDIAKRLHAELTLEISKHADGKRPMVDFNQRVTSRDGHRLFDKLEQLNKELYGGSPPLLTPGTFAECLAQYQKLIAHVERIWDDACRHYTENNYPFAAFLAILTIEEIGKLGRLWHDLLAWDRPMPSPRKDLGKLGRDHRKKHFMGVISGAVINERLNRVVGERRIMALLQDADSGNIEAFRQSCLYVDMVDGRIVLPEDRVSEADAKFYTIVAGELWADVLGHFPWDFERMLDKVIAFENSIGVEGRRK